MNAAVMVGCFLTSVLYVAFRSFQQLNVVRGRYSLLLPTSMAMASADYFIINTVASNPPWVIVAFGAGGATGCFLGMALDKRIRSWGKYGKDL